MDIDGTLTEAGCSVPPSSALRAIQRAREKGNLVFLCTGRNYAMLKPMLRYPFDGFVGSAGAYVVCGREIICDRPMRTEQKDRAIRSLEEKGVFYTMECKEASYTDGGFKKFLRQHLTVGANSEMLRWRQDNEKKYHIFPLSEYKGEPVYKISVVSIVRETMIEVKRILGKDYLFWIQDSGESGITNGEFMWNGTDKGTGILEICKFLQVPPEHTVAFGDSMNDYEMIQMAKIGIAMGNSVEKLKEEADYVTSSIGEDGIWSACEYFGLF